MILHRPAAAARLLPLAERLVRDVFDAGLVLGHSVRTVRQACRLATRDPMICTSLVDSRLLAGNPAIFESFMHGFRQRVRWRCGRLLAGIQQGRATKSGIATARRSSSWSPTSSARRARSAICSCSAGSALSATAWPTSPNSAIAAPQPGRLRRHPAGLRLSALAPQRVCTFTPGQANDVLTRAEQLRLAEQPRHGQRPTACCRSSISCATTSATPTASATWPTKFLAKATTQPVARQDADACSSATASSRTTWWGRWA